MSQAIEMKHDNAQYGIALLNDPVHNKGTAFGAKERAQYGLEGLPPPLMDSHERQTDRVTEVTTATRVAEFMFDQGLAQAEQPRDIRAWIESQLYKPRY
jgi:hypothetical protein